MTPPTTPTDSERTPRTTAALRVLQELMDTGFRSGERYVGAEELAFIFGHPFIFENEDGSETVFDGLESWLNDYPYRENDLGLALTALAEAAALPERAGLDPSHAFDKCLVCAAAVDDPEAMEPCAVIPDAEEDRRLEEAFDRESERKMAEGYNGE